MDPQAFYITKGIIGVIGTIILIVVMNQNWGNFDKGPDGVHRGVGQRLRYITLFYFAVLISSASYEQVRQSLETINLRNIGGFIGALLLIVTGIVSLVEYNDQRKRSSHGSQEDV